MECVCLGDVYDEDVKDFVDCVNLKEPFLGGYDRNYELFSNFNLGGLYEFLNSTVNSLKVNYLSTSRPTRFEHDSCARQLFKTVKNMFSHKKRKLTFKLTEEPRRRKNLFNSVTSPSCFDFFVSDRTVTLVSAYDGCNIRVTTIPVTAGFVLNKNLGNGPDFDYETFKGAGVKSFVLVTGKESPVTTLCVNDSLGFGFEVFVGFADKSVSFFRFNSNFSMEKGAQDSYTVSNVSSFLYLDDPATFSKFSPNRELLLVGTRTSLYLLEKNGFDLEYERLCELKGGMVCADFLNDFEIMVLENNYVMTVYKKYDLKYNKYIKYNLQSLLSTPTNLVTPAGMAGRGESDGGLPGKFVKDHSGNVYLMVRNMGLVKLTWNESLIPYSNNVVLEEPSNMSDNRFNGTGSRHKGLNKSVYNFNVENNMVAVTFTGSDVVHLYSLTSMKELQQLRPPMPNYSPKFVGSRSSSNSCFLVVLWRHHSNPGKRQEGEHKQGFERNPHHPDLMRSYRIKSSLTKEVTPDVEVTQDYEKYRDYRFGFNSFDELYEQKYTKLPKLSAFCPKIPKLQTKFKDFQKFDDTFESRRNLFGRSLSDHSRRMAHEPIYTFDEFVRNRRRLREPGVSH